MIFWLQLTNPDLKSAEICMYKALCGFVGVMSFDTLLHYHKIQSASELSTLNADVFSEMFLLLHYVFFYMLFYLCFLVRHIMKTFF